MRMRKALFLLPLTAILAAVSCTAEKEQDLYIPAEGPYMATVSVGLENDATRGTLVGDKTFQWQAGDQIGVYVYSTTLDNVPGSYGVEGEYGPWMAPFELQSGAGTGTGVFSRELNADLGETYGYVAIYPNTEGSSYTPSNDGGTLTMHLPWEYYGLQNLDQVRIPLVGVLDMDGDKTHFTLKHVGGAVKVTFKNVPAGAKYFKLSATDGNLNGDYTISLSDVGTGVLQGSGSGNSVQLTLVEGHAAETLVAYFPVPAGEFTFNVSVYGDGITYLENYGGKTKNTIGRGTVLRMPEVTIPTANLGQYDENLPTEKKASGLTYQVNVFSFADSDGDGWGDFQGIIDHLDYFDKLGVTALWLSPSQLAQSYHGYDVKDYSALNPKYGTDQDFQNLINAAHQHNIRIYMDYVINHTGDNHPWFLDVKKKGPSSEYWNYYALAQDPQAAVNAGQIPQIPQGWYNSGEWWPLMVGAGQQVKRYAIDLDWTNASAPTMTVSETSEAVTAGGSHNNPARYLLWGNGTYTQFADNGTNRYRVVLDYQSEWGCLVRTTDGDDWSNGTKWGLNASEQLVLGTPHTLYTGASDDVKNIVMPDATLYYYYSAFYTGAFADLNYYYGYNCETSPAFQAIVASIDKWLAMGLDGLRLDAVKHIFADDKGSDNIQFWQKFYNAVNSRYQAYAGKRSNLNGVSDSNIFMVGEVLAGASICMPFYQGLPAIFDFQYWWDLRTALNGENSGNFVADLQQRARWDIYDQRSSAIYTPKLSNHDEDRTATELGKYMPKMRLAATILLTTPGRPFIYQGEELGYWGSKYGGDEYVRAPILWTTSLSSAALGALDNKYDADMLKPSISVASQAADDSSLLMLYRHFAYARNTNPAMANGWIEADSKTSGNANMMGWYMHEIGGEKVCLVLHNISRETQTIERWEGENLSSILVASDPVKVSGQSVTMPPYSSVVFALN